MKSSDHKSLNSSEYIPSKEEHFMNEKQRNFFKKKLLQWRVELLNEEDGNSMDNQNESDVVDVASREADRSIKLVTKQREQILVHKIDEALRRIDEGTYGYCEETGEPIDLNRLTAYPITTLSLEAQERQEKLNKYKNSRL